MKFPTPHSVDTLQAKIHYFELGNPAGTPVILLHGFPDSPIAWAPVIDRLDTRKLRLIVPYLRGYGPTTVLSDDLIGGQEAALGHDLLLFANALGLERFHLAGHDWGARASYAACVFAPNRILSLLALATPYVMYGGKDYPPEQINANWYQWYFQLQLGQKALTENAQAFCRQLWRSWSPRWNFANRDFIAAAEAWKNPQFVPTVLHYYRTRWGGALSLRAYAELQAVLNANPKQRSPSPQSTSRVPKMLATCRHVPNTRPASSPHATSASCSKAPATSPTEKTPKPLPLTSPISSGSTPECSVSLDTADTNQIRRKESPALESGFSIVYCKHRKVPG
jgi:pimeloyl-ACP methyl ester carboxylesterase